MTCALLMLLTFVGACLCLWKWRNQERERKERRYIQRLRETRAAEVEHAWRVGKLVLSLEAGVESGAEVLIRPDLKQAVDTYLTKRPLNGKLSDLLDALQTLGLINRAHLEDKRWVEAYYNLRRWTAAYHDLIESGRQDQVLSLWERHPARCFNSVLPPWGLDQEWWRRLNRDKLKPYVDRVTEQPEPTNKAEGEAKAYAELAIRIGVYSTRHSHYWVQRVTKDEAEQIAAGAYGLCLYALRRGWVAGDAP